MKIECCCIGDFHQREIHFSFQQNSKRMLNSTFNRRTVKSRPDQSGLSASDTNSIKQLMRSGCVSGKNFFRCMTGFLILWFSWQGVMAQSRTITGTVKDNKDEAVIGASIIVKGTTTGTYTDEEGNFSIAVPSGSSALIIKYL